MSERGTFVTSFLYDWTNLSPVLERLLPKVCRKDALCAFRWPEGLGVTDQHLARWFSGLMHGGHGGEEALIMEEFINDVLLPALPEEHGEFSICVLPEWQQHTTVFTLLGHGRKVVRYAMKKERTSE
jgi:hypothetical protein